MSKSTILRLWFSAWAGLLILVGLGPACGSEKVSRFTASPVEKAAGGFQFTEGPVWHKDGYLLFSDIPANRIMKWTPDGKVTAFREDSGGANGLTFDPQGRLIACEHGNRRVSVTAADGTITAAAETCQGKKFNSPNDCAVRSDGMIFFTDPDYGLGRRAREIDVKGVYRVPPGSEAVLLAGDFDKPNGIAFSPDGKILYVADTAQSHVRAFDVEPDGSLKNGRVLFEVEGPDGMKVDSQGNLYIASRNGIEIFNAEGIRQEIIAVPENPANCAFGGPDNQTLFITARTGLYRVELTVPGVKVWK
ncbi:MAG: SMP-30/gluconolactonase/LRE family protein [Candidatus Omnitrophica bacterium]|nr:SMP-30/gluconolactonase/LRE family protein [Candidatus Omnitrophota bacterium]